MSNGLIVIIPPLVALCVVLASFVCWSIANERSAEKFAAAQGITYARWGKTPIAVPQVVGDRSVTEVNTFLYGPRHGGVEVFACHCKVGWGRGNIQWLSMVGIHAELHDVSGLDTRRWMLTPLNGWTFLIPRKPKGGTLKMKKIAALWDALTAAAQKVDGDPHRN